MGNYTLQQAQNDVAALRGQIAHLQAYAEILQLVIDTELTGPDGSTWDTSGIEMATGKHIVADTSWQTLSLAAGWTGGSTPVQYRLMPDGTVLWRGTATHASFSATTTISASAIPSKYWPAVTSDVPYAVPSAVISGINVSTSGVCVVRVGTGGTGTTCAPTGSYSTI